MVTGTVDNKRVSASEKALSACLDRKLINFSLDDFERMRLRDGRKYLEQPSMAWLRVEEGKPPMAEYMDRVRGLLFSGTVTGFTNDFQNMP